MQLSRRLPQVASGQLCRNGGGGREHSVLLPRSHPLVLLLQEQAWAWLGLHCVSLPGPLGLLLTQEAPDDDASPEHSHAGDFNALPEAPGP